jgi:DNA-binding winged helix-turn-helix (wHTH) protein/TolB-like protein
VTYRFGVFEFDSASDELRRSGRPVPLEPQPSRALGVLVSRADHLVTRDELKEAVWGKDTHVDFDRGLAYCISQIRTALGDAGDNPRFVQTIPKRGYRFIAPVQAPAPAPEPGDAPGDGATEPSHRPSVSLKHPLPLALLAAVLTLAGVVAALALLDIGKPSARVTVAVSLFDNETGLAEYDPLVSGLSDVVVSRLAELAPDRFAVIGNAAVLRQPRNLRNLKAVARGVNAEYVLLGQLQRAEPGFRFITHVIRLSDETHLKANRLLFPNGDLTELERRVLDEFERAVRQLALPHRE